MGWEDCMSLFSVEKLWIEEQCSSRTRIPYPYPPADRSISVATGFVKRLFALHRGLDPGRPAGFPLVLGLPRFLPLAFPGRRKGSRLFPGCPRSLCPSCVVVVARQPRRAITRMHASISHVRTAGNPPPCMAWRR